MKIYVISFIFIFISCQLTEPRDCTNSGKISISNRLAVSIVEFSDSSVTYNLIKHNNYEPTSLELQIVCDSIFKNFFINNNVTTAILKNLNATLPCLMEFKTLKVVKRKNEIIVLRRFN
jgi:hypothetical protein